MVHNLYEVAQNRFDIGATYDSYGCSAPAER
jgi:hypothetical protein